MPKFFVKNEQIIDNKITIIGEDVNHIKNVLRLKIDDNIHNKVFKKSFVINIIRRYSLTQTTFFVCFGCVNHEK